jgi:SAM-dependent methyltransferase
LPREEWLKSGLFLADLLCRTVGRNDLSDVDLLDVGCGTLMVQTLLNNSLPIRHYAGVDVSPEVIGFLRATVSDPRFEFHRLDAHNEMYNPDGTALEDFDLLPVRPRQFDLISLFSVFTHLVPDDFAAMLRLLRRHVKQDGTLLFSLFINDPQVIEDARRRVGATDGDPRFVDEVPSEPLLRARYTRDYAIELVDGTGWKIEGIHLPHPGGYIQHYMVCHPS